MSSPLPKSLRFEVLKRDKFACQYCGGKAPDVLLQVDHIHPESKGGKHDVLNLITSCQPCNSGKSDRLLSDNAAIEKKRGQLEELQERKEQIEMMCEWQMGLADLGQQTVDAVHEVIRKLTPGFGLGDKSLAEMRSYVTKYGVEAVCAEFRRSCAMHVVIVDGTATQESVERSYGAALSALKWKSHNERDPIGSQARYIRAVLRNRLRYVNERDALDLLTAALEEGHSFEMLKSMAIRVPSWTVWNKEILDLLEGASKDGS